MDKMAHDVNDQMLAEEFARGLRVVGKGHRIVSRDLGFMFGEDDFWLFVDDALHIARLIERNEDGSITVDLYRNLDDYRANRVMEYDFTYQPEKEEG